MSDETFDRKYPDARAIDQTPSHWPPDVRMLSMQGLNFLGLDTDGQLYWDGKPVAIRRKLDLSRVQNGWAILVGIAAIVGGIGSGLNNGVDFACNQGWLKQGCVSEQASHCPQTVKTPVDVTSGKAD